MGVISEKVSNAMNNIEDSIETLKTYHGELSNTDKAIISIFGTRLLKLAEER